MKKKLLAVFLALAMCLTLLPTVALAAGSESKVAIPDTGIIITNATEATAADGSYTAGEGTVVVEYDSETSTVTFTLTNAVINGSLSVSGGLNMAVKLNGRNEINASSESSDIGAVIAKEGALTVTGSADSSLTANGKSYALYGIKGVTIANADITATAGTTAAIQANAAITVSGSTVRATCGDKATDYNGHGIYVNAVGNDNLGYDISISDSNVTISCPKIAVYTQGAVKVTGSTITTEEFVPEPPGNNGPQNVLFGVKGVYVKDNSTLTANCQDVGLNAGSLKWVADASRPEGGYWDVDVASDIIIDNSSATIVSDSNGFSATRDIWIENSGDVSGKCAYPLLYARNVIQIDNSTVNSETTSNGIWADNSLNVINNSNVTAKGYYYGIAGVQGITITDSAVGACGEAGCGIFAPEGNIEISGDDTDKVKAKSNAEDNPALYTYYGNISISGGTVVVEGNGDDGIFAPEGNIEISGENTTLQVSNQNAEHNGINAGAFNISGGKVTVNSPGTGIFVDSSGGEQPFNITGGELTVNAGERGVDASNSDVNISGGKLIVKSTSNGGILANSLTLGGGETSVNVADDKNPISVYVSDGVNLNGGKLLLPNGAANGSIITGYLTSEKEYYLVNLDAQNGDPLKSVLVEKGQKLSDETPEKAGYTFDGWYSAASGGEKWGLETGVAAHMTLYAQWKQNSSPVTPPSKPSEPSKPSVSVDGDGGAVTSDRNGTATITPDEGYQIEKITVNGKEVEIPADGKLTGLKPSDKVVVTFTEVPVAPIVTVEQFVDVAPGAWYYDAVKYAVEHGLFYGTSDTTFGPNSTMTRGMLATVLYRMESEPEADASDFLDVESGQYYSEAVAWAAANGIVAGYGNGNFGPEDALTREQLATILYRYSGSPASSGALAGFADADKASGYALDALRWAVEQGILQGKNGGVLDPIGNVTRAEVAAMLQRFCEKAGR